MQNYQAAIFRGGEFTTKHRGEDALCYREPCALPLTGATAGAPEPQRVRLTAYERSRRTAEKLRRVYTHTQNFFSLTSFGGESSSSFYARRCRTFTPRC